MKLEPIESNDMIYDLYGIFIDYLIDTNPFVAMYNSYSYENFQNSKKWYVAKIEIKDKRYLIVDIDLKRFSYCNYVNLDKKILKSNLNSEDAIEELKSYSKLLGLDVLNQMKFYISGEAVNYQFV